MKHLTRWRTITAAGATAAVATGSLGIAAFASPVEAPPIELVAESEVGTDDAGPGSGTVRLASLDSPDSAASPASANSADSPDTVESPGSPTSPDSPDSVDSPDSWDSAEAYGRFRDVHRDNVHAPNVEALAERGIAAGRGDDLYDPRGHVTRAQFATFLARGLGLEPVPGQRFSDVGGDHTHAPSINAVAEAGIASGVNGTSFDPDARLSRAQLASLLARALELDAARSGYFTDVEPGSTHASAIDAVAEAGIASGVTETTFDPDRTVRRDQMASMIVRALSR